MGKILGTRGLRKRFVSSLLATRQKAKPQTPKEAVDQNTYMLAERARLTALTLRLRAGAVKVEAARGLSDAAQSLQYTTFWEYTP